MGPHGEREKSLTPVGFEPTTSGTARRSLGTCHYLADGGEGGGGYQFFKQGSQKILTLPLNTKKKL